jgi:type I restriction enzyme M protein
LTSFRKAGQGLPRKSKKDKPSKPTSGATVGYEQQLWQMADALRGSMDAAEYKHVVLGLIFLKYISDAFEEQHAKLVADKKSGADPEDPDEYRALSIFWVPPEARWAHLTITPSPNSVFSPKPRCSPDSESAC